MATDEQILDAIIGREGGYVDDPIDRGGPTKYGITQATLTTWRGRYCTPEDVRGLSEDEAREIYRRRYLEPFKDADPDVRAQLIDIAVTSGVSRAKAIQALASALHPKLSPNTAIALERIKAFGRLVQVNPAQARFLAGWINRAAEFIQ